MLILLVSLIIPCYNEEKVIQLFYKEIVKVSEQLTDYNFEFIFIDDGSSDYTLKLIKFLRESDERIRFVSFSRNFGKEAAIFSGLQSAKGDFITIIDADLQDPPSLLGEMLKYIKNEGYDSVATRRVTRKGEPVIRSLLARLFYKLINRMTNVEIVDGARDYRLMTKQFKDAVLSIGESHRFSKGIFGWVGFKTKWIEFENVERSAGETKWSFWKLFKYAIDGIACFTTVPLRFASIVGICVSITAFLYLIFIVVRTLIFGIDVAGYASTMAVVLFTSGLMLTSVGILGEYLARTYIEVKKRPIYIAKETEQTILTILNNEKLY